LEIPDAIFRRAKAKAAERGVPFRQFVTEAVQDKISRNRHFDFVPRLKRIAS